VFTILNTEVKLNDYSYPGWAHGIGWFIVFTLLVPLVVGFIFSTRKVGFKNVSEVIF
jgi:hypothetical protein